MSAPAQYPELPEPADSAYINGPQGGEYRSLANSFEPGCAMFSPDQMRAYVDAAREQDRARAAAPTISTQYGDAEVRERSGKLLAVVTAGPHQPPMLGKLKELMRAAPQAAVGPMAKMAQALREKAAAERSDFDRRVQSGEWGTMPGPETEADDLPDHVAEIEGDDAVRELRWNKRIGAFNYPVGTKLYAAPTQPQPEHEPSPHVANIAATEHDAQQAHLLEKFGPMAAGMPRDSDQWAESAPEAPALFRALLIAERDATIDVSGDIARQEAQIDLADHLLVKFNELFPEAPNVCT